MDGSVLKHVRNRYRSRCSDYALTAAKKITAKEKGDHYMTVYGNFDVFQNISKMNANNEKLKRML